MATPTVAEMTETILDRLQANVATDPAFTAAEILRHLNEAYSDMWEMSGGSMKRVAHATLWTPSPSSSTDGKFTSILGDIGEIKDIFHTTTSGSTGDVTAGDDPLEPVDLSEVQFMRANQALFGSYYVPRIYAVTRNFTTTPADVNKVQLDVWPGVSGVYLPTHYIPQFTPLDATITTPSLNDIEGRDLALLAASRMAPLTGRAELVPGILADVSQRTSEALERKLSALMHARADR